MDRQASLTSARQFSRNGDRVAVDDHIEVACLTGQEQVADDPTHEIRDPTT
jgi:hypothetical protein